VIEPSLLIGTTTYTDFGVLAGIVRFHGYTGGFAAGVYQTLRVFALPPTALTIADLIRIAIRNIRDSMRGLVVGWTVLISKSPDMSGPLVGEKAPGYFFCRQ
jgi:hypothetical protein